MKKHVEQKMVILGAFILGVIISIYLKSLDPDKVYITLEEKKDIENQIDIKRKEIKKLVLIKEKYKKGLLEYEEVLEDSNKSIMDLMEEELIYLKKISGHVDMVGPGITVVIKDSEKDLERGQNPNDLLVHDIDILRIVNDLKKSGAEAISINGERVLPTSEIKCSGATITVNETTYGQPFEIKAIGDRESLMASILSPQSYANLLVEGYGIFVEAKEENEIVIDSIK